MQTKEPYFQDDLTQKYFYSPSAQLMKIQNTTDLPNLTMESVSTPRLSLRRLSMEPYYKSTSRRNTIASAVSSYAMLSDVFDYHYLDFKDNEHAIASDSESDYEDEESAVFAKRKPQVSTAPDESESDSELEDYKVHFLTFKVTSRAQYCTPPRSSTLSASDIFDDVISPKEDFSVISTLHHPDLASSAWKCLIRPVDYLDDVPDQVLTTYEQQQQNPIAVLEQRQRKCSSVSVAPGATFKAARDNYEGALPRFGLTSDAYDMPCPEFCI